MLYSPYLGVELPNRVIFDVLGRMLKMANCMILKQYSESCAWVETCK